MHSSRVDDEHEVRARDVFRRRGRERTGGRGVMPLVYVRYALLVVACAAILFPHRGGRVDRVGAGGLAI